MPKRISNKPKSLFSNKSAIKSKQLLISCRTSYWYSCCSSYLMLTASLPVLCNRADASEKSTKIAYSVIMKSANYPHANLANLAKGASLCPRLSAPPPTRMSVGCDDCRFIGTKECCLQPFQPDGKLRAFCDAVFA